VINPLISSTHTISTPQYRILSHSVKERFRDIPRLQRVQQLKTDIIEERSTPSLYKQADLSRIGGRLSELGQFDVVLVEPPLLEYSTRAPGSVQTVPSWDWAQIQSLDIKGVSAPSPLQCNTQLHAPQLHAPPNWNSDNPRSSIWGSPFS
jgi:hypothetical protein